MHAVIAENTHLIYAERHNLFLTLMNLNREILVIREVILDKGVSAFRMHRLICRLCRRVNYMLAIRPYTYICLELKRDNNNIIHIARITCSLDTSFVLYVPCLLARFWVRKQEGYFSHLKIIPENFPGKLFREHKNLANRRIIYKCFFRSWL